MKHLPIAGVMVALLLLALATVAYPGGSQADAQATGFDWGNNYLCNLFGETAVNGAANSARGWAIAGWLFLCISIAGFFIDFARKIPHRNAATIIRYFGASSMGVAFLAVTPYHDPALTVASFLALVSIFYITVFLFKSRLTYIKGLSVLCLLILYTCNYVYYTQQFLSTLPILQKIGLLVTLIWAIALHYFTQKEDFQPKNA